MWDAVRNLLDAYRNENVELRREIIKLRTEREVADQLQEKALGVVQADEDSFRRYLKENGLLLPHELPSSTPDPRGLGKNPPIQDTLVRPETSLWT